VGGSSKIACTDTYSGPAPFSEKETQALMAFYETIAPKVDAYIAFHSAAELLLYPMGHTSSSDLVPNKEHLVSQIICKDRTKQIILRFSKKLQLLQFKLSKLDME
jgi:Zinc carboxypeptidase